APSLARLLVAALVADEELDRMAENRIGELARGGERLVAVTKLLPEQMVDSGEHLWPRAVVQRQRKSLLRQLAALTEHGNVGVPEAVDRLELVADGEDVDLPRPGEQQVDDVRLQPVG